MILQNLLQDLTLVENGRYIVTINKLVLYNKYLYNIIKSDFLTCRLETSLKDYSLKMNLIKNDFDLFNLLILINKENNVLIGKNYG